MKRNFCLLMAIFAALAAAAQAGIGADTAEAIRKAEEYVIKLQELKGLYEEAVQAVTHKYEQRQGLYQGGLISLQDLESGRTALNEAQAKVDDVKMQITTAGKFIAEARLAEELEQGSAAEAQVKEAVIFYSGATPWSMANAGKIETFFITRFGISLPVSAVGQTELHTRLGFDHREALDVALHPDSPEGQGLMEYLRTAGYSFVAFRQALSGSATGAHIHVGRPSVRVSAHNKSNGAIYAERAGS